MTLLSVTNVGKSFRKYKSEWHRFANWFGLKLKPVKEHWVLRNLNFDIHSGEALGIIGQNGAGKSTLLKMLTGTLQSTEGNILNNGYVREKPKSLKNNTHGFFSELQDFFFIQTTYVNVID